MIEDDDYMRITPWISVPSENKHRCMFCGIYLESEDILRKHYQTAHTEELDKAL